jgi:hypothetical protein
MGSYLDALKNSGYDVTGVKGYQYNYKPFDRNANKAASLQLAKRVVAADKAVNGFLGSYTILSALLGRKQITKKGFLIKMARETTAFLVQVYGGRLASVGLVASNAVFDYMEYKRAKGLLPKDVLKSVRNKFIAGNATTAIATIAHQKVLDYFMGQLGQLTKDPIDIKVQSILSKIVLSRSSNKVDKDAGSPATTIYDYGGYVLTSSYNILTHQESGSSAAISHELGHQMESETINGKFIKGVQIYGTTIQNTLIGYTEPLVMACGLMCGRYKDKKLLCKVMKQFPRAIFLASGFLQLCPEFMASYNGMKVLNEIYDTMGISEDKKVELKSRNLKLLILAFSTYALGVIARGGSLISTEAFIECEVAIKSKLDEMGVDEDDLNDTKAGM